VSVSSKELLRRTVNIFSVTEEGCVGCGVSAAHAPAQTRYGLHKEGGILIDIVSDAKRFELLIGAVTDYAIYMLDPNGIVTSWNSGAQRFKGYKASEIIGQHFSRFYTDADRAEGQPERMLQIAAEEGRYEAEGWRVRQDGSLFWASVVIDAIRAEDGTLLGFAKITRDITEKKQAQETLEQTRAALFQAQKMEAIGQLTGGIAHDLNNLLTVIANGLDLLSRNLRDPRDLRRLDAAQRATDRGAKLTQQLLAFARRQPLRPQRQSPAALIRDFEPVLRRACSANIDIEFDLQARTHQCDIDGPQFEAAILNLVVNARDAMPSGGRLQVRTSAVALDAVKREAVTRSAGADAPAITATASEFVLVEVVDTGTGMPPEVQVRAFDPFFTTKEVGKGTGLGLSQVYGFVTQTGGMVEIDSTQGRGTAIRIYLPAAERVSTEADPASEIVDEHGQQAGTVLIVEDESEVLDIAAEIFQSLGYQVHTAQEAYSALDHLRHSRNIDVLFTDVIMPRGMNGIELAREARKLRPDIMVLLASGYPIPALSAEFGALDEFAFLSKPYRWAEVADRLKSLRAAGSS
jgi:PAS domain S-box-containing protein